MIERPKCDNPWTNTDAVLALVVTRFCNFHFVKLFFTENLLYLRVIDFGQMFRFTSYKYGTLAKERMGYIPISPQLLETRTNEEKYLMLL